MRDPGIAAKSGLDISRHLIVRSSQIAFFLPSAASSASVALDVVRMSRWLTVAAAGPTVKLAVMGECPAPGESPANSRPQSLRQIPSSACRFLDWTSMLGGPAQVLPPCKLYNPLT